MTSWPIVLGVLEYLLRRSQHIVNDLNADDDDFELDGPISRDKDNDPFELILMGYKTFMSKIDSEDGTNFEQIQLGYQSSLQWRMNLWQVFRTPKIRKSGQSLRDRL